MEQKSNFDMNDDSQYEKRGHISQTSSNTILEEVCQTLRGHRSFERPTIKLYSRKIVIHEDLSHQNIYVQNNFAFEPLLDHKPLNIQIGKKSQIGSYTFSTLAAFLSRHKVIYALGEGLEDFETEQSIQQNIGFLNFLKEHQPFKTGADEKLLRNQDIFKHFQLLDLICSNAERINDTEIQSKLFEALKFYKEEMTSKEDKKIFKTINKLVPSIPIDSKTELKTIAQICEILRTQLEEKLKYINTHSVYYIKMQIEELYSLAGPGHKLKTHDLDAIRHFAKRAFQALKESQVSLLENSDSFQDIEKNGFDDSNPKKTWVNILNCYYDFVSELKLSLLERLSRGYDDETKEFFAFLLEHPLSFFASKEIWDVNWNLVDDLIALYDQPVAQSDRILNPFHKKLSEINLFCIDLSLRFQFVGDKKDDHPYKFFTLESVTCGEKLEPNSLIYTFDSNSEEFPKKICSKIIRRIEVHLNAFERQVLQKKAAFSHKIGKINKVEIDFYSTHYDKKLYQNIQDELKKQISKSRQIKEYLGDVSNQIIETFFSYTVKDFDDDDDDSDSDSMSNKGKNEVEEKCRKVSLFNYDYLHEILLEKHIGNLEEKNFGILQEEIKDLSQ